MSILSKISEPFLARRVPLLLALAIQQGNAQENRIQLCGLLHDTVGIAQALSEPLSEAKIKVVDVLRMAQPPFVYYPGDRSASEKFAEKVIELQTLYPDFSDSFGVFDGGFDTFLFDQMKVAINSSTETNLKAFLTYVLLKESSEEELSQIEQSLRRVFPMESARQDSVSLARTRDGIVWGGQDWLMNSLITFYFNSMRLGAPAGPLSSSDVQRMIKLNRLEISKCQQIESSVLNRVISLLDQVPAAEIEATKVSWYEGRGTIAISDAHNSMDRKQIFNMRLRAVAKRSAIQHFQLSSMDSAYSQAILKHRYVPRVEETAYPRTVQFTIADDAPKSGS